jgi:excisionase family DNA binding protein
MDVLSISRRTVYRYVELGYLPKRSLPGRGNRFARADVLALLKDPRASEAS